MIVESHWTFYTFVCRWLTNCSARHLHQDHYTKYYLGNRTSHCEYRFLHSTMLIPVTRSPEYSSYLWLRNCHSVAFQFLIKIVEEKLSQSILCCQSRYGFRCQSRFKHTRLTYPEKTYQLQSGYGDNPSIPLSETAPSQWMRSRCIPSHEI